MATSVLDCVNQPPCVPRLTPHARVSILMRGAAFALPEASSSGRAGSVVELAGNRRGYREVDGFVTERTGCYDFRLETVSDEAVAERCEPPAAEPTREMRAPNPEFLESADR